MGSRIYSVPFAISVNEEEWPKIQDSIIDAMNRLEDALRPHLKKALTLGTWSAKPGNHMVDFGDVFFNSRIDKLYCAPYDLD